LQVVLREFSPVVSARRRISSATTAKPLSASPAWAASMAAFIDKILVFSDRLLITSVISYITEVDWAILRVPSKVLCMFSVMF